MTSTTLSPVAIVTGAAGALGQATAQHFLVAGYRVALFDRNAQRLQTLFGAPAHALLLGADITSADSVSRATQTVLQAFGRVDALVHVAGGFEMGEAVQQLSRESWDRMMDLNAWSFVNVCRDVIPLMKHQGAGRVVAVSSHGAREGLALKGAYSAAKSALQRLVESLSHEVSAEGINVNSVAPTTLDTPANRQAIPDADRSAWVSLDAAVHAIAFLASPAASAIHGQHLQLGTTSG